MGAVIEANGVIIRRFALSLGDVTVNRPGVGAANTAIDLLGRLEEELGAPDFGDVLQEFEDVVDLYRAGGPDPDAGNKPAFLNVMLQNLAAAYPGHFIQADLNEDDVNKGLRCYWTWNCHRPAIRSPTRDVHLRDCAEFFGINGVNAAVSTHTTHEAPAYACSSTRSLTHVLMTFALLRSAICSGVRMSIRTSTLTS